MVVIQSLRYVLIGFGAAVYGAGLAAAPPRSLGIARNNAVATIDRYQNHSPNRVNQVRLVE
jgi:hypothetical protein